MSSITLVTATSFMRSATLRAELEEGLRSVPGAVQVHYLDLREISARALLMDPLFAARITSWLVGGESVGVAELEGLPHLKRVSKYGVGLDNIDFQACQARGVSVHFEAGVNSLAVAEHTLGLIIAMTRNIYNNSNMLRSGVWNKDGGRGLSGMKVGLVGLGHVGSKVASLLKMLGAEVTYAELEDKFAEEKSLNIRRLSFDDLLSSNELLSFHVPLTDQTYKMMNERAFRSAKDGLYLVNTSRGQVIDEKALKIALKSGKVRGAALDVFENEPLHDKELAESERLIGTPHTAGNSEQAVKAMGQAAIRGIISHYKILGP
ncbi:MAG: hydroxyacid dehydrogenase [Proteobacteria bacterium]|nr:MAG: hydroxyacid dehydrogenase [Pseudomonadota bacterium]